MRDYHQRNLKLIDNEWYHESSFTLLLTHQSILKLKEDLQDKRCKTCGARLEIMQYMEGPFVACKWSTHDSGYEIDLSSIDIPPTIKEPKI